MPSTSLAFSSPSRPLRPPPYRRTERRHRAQCSGAAGGPATPGPGSDTSAGIDADAGDPADPAARSGYAGTAADDRAAQILRVLVDVNGKPLKVLIDQSSGHVLLDRSASRQVFAAWLFQAAIVGGKHVQAWGPRAAEFRSAPSLAAPLHSGGIARLDRAARQRPGLF